MKKFIFLRTFGCQMNKRDSEIVRGMLEEKGYAFTENEDKADIILFNTCSVREHAEHRALSILGALSRKNIKQKKRIFGLIGCVAQHRKEALFKSLPKLNFICGPSDIYRIPELITSVDSGQGTGKSKLVSLGEKTRPLQYHNPIFRESKTHAYVNIMYGCNNYCSYCIVPYVRGREVSRPVKDILKEIEGLVESGISDITLLGQNVNSYKADQCDFVGLLRIVNGIDGVKAIAFMTSHPKDATIELYMAMRDLDNVKKELHLPLQCGSNRILELMNRGYTIEKYMDLVKNYRKIVPNCTITTDVIVGFPTETEEDFEVTRKAMEEIGFDSAYVFKYSPRPPAKSAAMRDDVTVGEKKRRHGVLLDLVKRRGVTC